jgi:hypothetical protein
MTEPRDDEAGREALLRAMGRVLVELSYKPNDLTHEVLREAAEELRATLAPPAATAPSVRLADVRDRYAQMGDATWFKAAHAGKPLMEDEAPTPRDEAAALLREAATLLNGGDTQRERDICQRIDAYLRRAGPEGGERSA